MKNKILIDPKEAMRLYEFVGLDALTAAHDLAKAFLKRCEERGCDPDDPNMALSMLACVWSMGRVNGIREVRLHNKERELTRNSPDCKLGKPIRTTAGLIIPTLSMDYFINTSEGGRLYAVCTAASDEAMRPYKEAKAAWEAQQKSGK